MNRHWKMKPSSNKSSRGGPPALRPRTQPDVKIQELTELTRVLHPRTKDLLLIVAQRPTRSSDSHRPKKLGHGKAGRVIVAPRPPPASVKRVTTGCKEIGVKASANPETEGSIVGKNVGVQTTDTCPGDRKGTSVAVRDRKQEAAMLKKFQRNLERRREGKTPIKFRFDIRIVELAGLPSTVKTCRVVWARGPKVQMTKLEAAKEGTVQYGQVLSQVATIYKASGNSFEAKEYTFKVQAPSKGNESKIVTLGRTGINLAEYASLEAKTHELDIPIGFEFGKTKSMGVLQVVIFGQILKGLGPDDAMTEVSGLSGFTTNTELNDQDLAGFDPADSPMSNENEVFATKSKKSIAAQVGSSSLDLSGSSGQESARMQEELGVEVAKTREERDVLKAEVMALRSEREKWEFDMEQMEEDLENAEKEKFNVERKVKQLVETLAGVQQEVETEKKTNVFLQSELDRVRTSLIAESQLALAEAEEKLVEAEKQLEQEREQHALQIETLQMEAKQLSKDLEGRKQELKKQIDKFDAAHLHWEEQKQALQLEISEIKATGGMCESDSQIEFDVEIRRRSASRSIGSFSDPPQARLVSVREDGRFTPDSLDFPKEHKSHSKTESNGEITFVLTENQVLQRQLSRSESVTEGLKMDLHVALARAEDSDRSCREAAEELQRVEAERDSMGAKLRDMGMEMDKLVNEQRGLEEQIANLEVFRIDAQKQLSNQAESVKEAEEKLVDLDPVHSSGSDDTRERVTKLEMQVVESERELMVANREIVRLQETVKEEQDKAIGLESDLEAARGKLLSCRRVTKDMETAMEAVERRFVCNVQNVEALLTQEIGKARDEKDQWETGRDDVDLRLLAFQGELEKLGKDLGDQLHLLESNLSKSEEAAMESEKERAVWKEAAQKLEIQVEELIRTRDELSTQTEAAEKVVKDLSEQLSHLQAENESGSRELTEAHLVISRLEASLKASTATSEEKDATITTLLIDLEQLRSESQRLTSENERLREKYRASQSSLSDFEEQTNVLEQEKIQLESANANLLRDLDSARQKSVSIAKDLETVRAEADKKLAMLMHDFENFQTESNEKESSMKQEVEESQRALEQSKLDTQKGKDEILDLKKQIGKISEECEGLREANEAMLEKLGKGAEEIERLETEIDQMRIKLRGSDDQGNGGSDGQALSDEQREAVVGLQRELESAKQHIAEIEEELQGLKLERESFEAEKSALNLSLKEASHSQQEAEQKLSQIGQEVLTLKQQILDKEVKIGEMDAVVVNLRSGGSGIEDNRKSVSVDEDVGALMQELVMAKMNLAELHENYIVVKRDLCKSKESNMKLASKMTKLETLLYAGQNHQR